jgi:hypothetical protein
MFLFLAINAKVGEILSPKQKDRTINFKKKLFEMMIYLVFTKVSFSNWYLVISNFFNWYDIFNWYI